MAKQRVERRSRPAMRAETQRRLVEAAAEVFAERGFAGASLEAISKRAGYTRGAFHWYFSSKDELLVAVLRERLARRIEATDDTVMQAEGPLAFNRVQRQQAGRVPSAERRQWSLLMLEFWLHAVRQPDLRKEGARLKADLRAAMTKQVERLLDSVSAEPPLAPDLLASALIALEDGFALQELLDPEDHPSEKLWDVLDFFAESVLQRSERPS